jgi:hypothetical protein
MTVLERPVDAGRRPSLPAGIKAKVGSGAPDMAGDDDKARAQAPD